MRKDPSTKESCMMLFCGCAATIGFLVVLLRLAYSLVVDHEIRHGRDFLIWLVLFVLTMKTIAAADPENQ